MLFLARLNYLIHSRVNFNKFQLFKKFQKLIFFKDFSYHLMFNHIAIKFVVLSNKAALLRNRRISTRK